MTAITLSQKKGNKMMTIKQMQCADKIAKRILKDKRVIFRSYLSEKRIPESHDCKISPVQWEFDSGCMLPENFWVSVRLCDMPSYLKGIERVTMFYDQKQDCLTLPNEEIWGIVNGIEQKVGEIKRQIFI
jgi:hypothetical protein